MKQAHITAAEWEVMNALWTRGPLSAADIVDHVAARKPWRRRTTRTLIDRLVGKGALAVDAKSTPHVYSPKISLQDCIRAESRSFLDRAFGGEPVAMLLHLVEETPLTPEDIRKLKRILKDKER